METGEKSFYIIAHRGASAYMPENTVASFRKAIELNADLIELDVRRTLDNRLVVIHDSKIDRTTNGSGYVCEKTLDELRQYDAGDGEQIPTLEEVLELANDGTGFVIELKEERTEDQVIDITKQFGIAERVFLVSFKSKVIKYIKTAEPSVRSALISLHPFRVVEKGLKCGADAIGLSKYFINERLVQSTHNNDMLIFAWTVDSPARARKLREMNVDGIVTNKPDIMDQMNNE